MAIILVNNQAKELTVLDRNNIDYSNDLIGSFSDTKRIDPDDNCFQAQWEMTQDNFDWFVELRDLLYKQEELEDNYIQKHGELPEEYYQIAMDEETRDAVEKQIEWLESQARPVYVIIRNTIELPYKKHGVYIKEYKPGCSLDQQDQYPEDVKTFDTLEQAQKEIQSEKYAPSKKGIEWTEYLIEERIPDGNDYCSEYYFRG